jgi:molybdate transport system ATP-binding protein
MTGAAVDADIVVARPDGFRLRARIEVAPGEVTAVMGPSGAGKSTLVDALAGLCRLTDGHVRVGGRMLADTASGIHVRPAHRGIVLLRQQPSLFPHLTALENVAFGLRARRVPRRRAAEEAQGWLDRVGLAHAAGRRPQGLSGGEQQRVAVARALAVAPQVVLLDEPFTALDPQTESELRALVAEQLADTGATAVVVTHDALDAAVLARDLVVIEHGAVVQRGATLDVLRRPESAYVAAVAGVNRVDGHVKGSEWRADAGSLAIPLPQVSSAAVRHPSAAVFRPADVRAFVAEPSGGQVAWPARIVRIERQPVGVRIHTAEPPIAVDLTAEDFATNALHAGQEVWLAVRYDAVRLIDSPSRVA